MNFEMAYPKTLFAQHNARSVLFCLLADVLRIQFVNLTGCYIAMLLKYTPTWLAGPLRCLYQVRYVQAWKFTERKQIMQACEQHAQVCYRKCVRIFEAGRLSADLQFDFVEYFAFMIIAAVIKALATLPLCDNWRGNPFWHK